MVTGSVVKQVPVSYTHLDVYKRQDLQSKDLNNENDIKDFIMSVAKVTNKPITPSKVDKLVSMIKSNKIPKDIDKMV